MPKQTRRSWKHDGQSMPYAFKSKMGDGSYVEKGTRIVDLCYADLVYLASRPDSDKDIYGIKAQAQDELRRRKAHSKALDEVKETINFSQGRAGFLELAATL